MIKINPELEKEAATLARKIINENLEMASGIDIHSVSFDVVRVDSKEDVKRQEQKANCPLWIPIRVDGNIFRVYL
jgi:hypothetical protein